MSENTDRQVERESDRASDREFDIVLVGATGFTGGLTADYLATRLPTGARWALAGRSPERLAQVRDRLALAAEEAEGTGSGSRSESRPGPYAEPALLRADVTDPASLADVARRARVVVTTVGPYLLHGEPLVRACAEAGTDYLDLTGEPEFVDKMYLAHHRTAWKSGARLIHACGFDSVPHDIGVFHAVQELAARVGGRLDGKVSVRGVVRTNAGLSGGTFHSALTQLSRGPQLVTTARARRRLEREDPALAAPRGTRSVQHHLGTPHKDPELGYWLAPLPTIDPDIVVRSAAALPEYGPDFHYSHYAGTRQLRSVVGGIAGVAGLAAAAQVPPLRHWLASKVPAGEGPSPRKRERSWFTVDLVAEAQRPDGRPVTVHTRVGGGDPGYTETSRMLGETALAAAFDETPTVAGQVTTAQAFGSVLLDRLRAAGLRFDTVD